MSDFIRLHIGGTQAKPGWKILNVQPGPSVDLVGNCKDLSQFADGTVAEIYAAHVYEHLSYRSEVIPALKEAHRILAPGGIFRISVPDLEKLAAMFLLPSLDVNQRVFVMQMMFGGQGDTFDFHKVGFSEPILVGFLSHVGFQRFRRVEKFDLFDDDSLIRFGGELVSLNMEAWK